MIRTYIPKLEDLYLREKLLNDEATMKKVIYTEKVNRILKEYQYNAIIEAIKHFKLIK